MINAKTGKIFDVKEILVGCVIAVLGSMLIAYLAFGRNFFTFGTETDFVSRNMKDAQRLLNGEPMLNHFHPPLYSIIIALFFCILRDWFLSGLIVSFISSSVVLATSFVLFYKLAGRYAAWGSLAGLMSSRIFLTYSSFATQDLFFLACYSSCFCIAILAMQKGSRILWGVTGFILGCALLTRANAVTLLILFSFPWFQNRDLRARFLDFASVLIICTVVIGIWGITAKLTGSPFGTQVGHLSLATKYFPPPVDPFTTEARQYLLEKFPTYMDVLIFDPKHIAVTYVNDILQNSRRMFLSTELLSFPMLLFALPGIFLLFFVPRTTFALLFLFSTICQFALLGLKDYEPRHYLFMIPILGAGAGFIFQYILQEMPKGWKKFYIFIIIFPFIVMWLKDARYIMKETKQELHAQDEELGEVIQKARSLIDPAGVVISFREHISFYLGVRHAELSDVNGIEDFRIKIQNLREDGPIYIYFGPDEKRFRPLLGELVSAESVPDWLEFVTRGGSPNNWILYRYKQSP